MSEQIVIGQLKQPFHIKPESPFKGSQTQPAEWDHRAMWSYLRLQYTKKEADSKINDHFSLSQKLSKKERKKEMELLFADLVAQQGKPRKLQFIFEGDKVIAVASLKHLLIPPSKVYRMAKRILSKSYGQAKLIRVRQLDGLAYEVKHESGIQLGLQVYGGCITTRHAITLTSFLRVESCLNTLSWLGIGNFGSLGILGSGFERILRIKVKSNLEKRLKTAIEQALGNMGAIEGRVSRAEQVILEGEEARIIASAFGLSYSLGVRTIKQILERYAKEQDSLWGLSMASSWVASHGEFRKTPKNQNRAVEQKLSTIAGATLLIDNIKTTTQKSLEWLKNHIRKGEIKSIDELIGDLI